MISFESDYNNGMLPEILEALGKTNSDKTSGYGFDPYSESEQKRKSDKAVGQRECRSVLPDRRT
ncbi:low specificity L-threonine aldolase, partial [human gut metagenome]